jgi:hypothetical protein
MTVTIDDSYGRGGGVRRGLADGWGLGVGVGEGVDVGVAVGVGIASWV